MWGESGVVSCGELQRGEVSAPRQRNLAGTIGILNMRLMDALAERAMHPDVLYTLNSQGVPL